MSAQRKKLVLRISLMLCRIHCQGIRTMQHKDLSVGTHSAHLSFFVKHSFICREKHALTWRSEVNGHSPLCCRILNILWDCDPKTQYKAIDRFLLCRFVLMLKGIMLNGQKKNENIMLTKKEQSWNVLYTFKIFKYIKIFELSVNKIYNFRFSLMRLIV